MNEAAAYYQKAIEIDNDNTLAHNNLGYALLVSGEYFEAVHQFQEALRVSPEFAAAHFNLGRALHALRHLRGAIAEYREAVGCSRTMPTPTVTWGSRCLRTVSASRRRRNSARHSRSSPITWKPAVISSCCKRTGVRGCTISDGMERNEAGPRNRRSDRPLPSESRLNGCRLLLRRTDDAGENVEIERLDEAGLPAFDGQRAHHRVVGAQPQGAMCNSMSRRFASSSSRWRKRALAATPPPTQSVRSPV